MKTIKEREAILDEMKALFEKKKAALDRAILATDALDWLKSYGPRGPQPNNESIGASVSQNYASGCRGAPQARHYLEAAIRAMFGDINDLAIAMAEKDLSGGEED